MQIGRLYSTATPRMALMESSRPVCWISSSPRLPVNDRPAQIADALVLLADADQPRIGELGERPQQAFAGGDVGNRDDELDAARLDLADDAFRRTAPPPSGPPRLHSLTFQPPALSGANASTGKLGRREGRRGSPHAVAADLQIGVARRLLAEIAGHRLGMIHADDRAARGAGNQVAGDHRGAGAARPPKPRCRAARCAPRCRSPRRRACRRPSRP